MKKTMTWEEMTVDRRWDSYALQDMSLSDLMEIFGLEQIPPDWNISLTVRGDNITLEWMPTEQHLVGVANRLGL